MTAEPRNTIVLCHVGFKRRATKILVVRGVSEPFPAEYLLEALDHRPVHLIRPLAPVRSDFGTFLTADFSDVDQPGLFQISTGSRVVNGDRFGGELSAPFFIRDDAWRRTIPKAFGYIHFQRCGVEVPGGHDACHMDDGKQKDTGEHVDATGGWHDAGDFVKPTDYIALTAVAMMKLMQELPETRSGDVTREQLLEEVRFGNRFLLNMQDVDGRVWLGLGGNNYTDNVVGTADDRTVETWKIQGSTATFVGLEGLIAQKCAESDAAYARTCLNAGLRAWKTAGEPPASTLDLARWISGGCELYRASRDAAVGAKTIEFGRELLRRQNTSFIENQRVVRGFWTEEGEPYVNQDPIRRTVDSGMPAQAMIDLYETFPAAEGRSQWRDAVQMHVDEYLLPLAERNAYRMIPVGLYIGEPTPETYRPLSGNLTYRYFMPAREFYWWVGTTGHLLSNALMLGRFARISGDTGRQYVDLAYRQLEWVLGANPFGSSLMMGVGLHNPMPFSMFNGLIPGGILNGIGGNRADEPVLNRTNAMDWRTCEYWSPHAAYYLWANAVLENMA
jgi:hypothetical protein